ncbi:MBL fold metallo-hydrolase [Ruegeria marina]|uniref:Glyoxylase, beta-lactamase superfamily II n=1 Tax=Ruegeria marina TaxID=639004 RepID=A0A1G6YB97_9RHOB|nr:MBL fold metallo-hydrolase [Ruegeria marina]SDD87669.1 Glyoxylase, beta-lactamase superfamily II [Ruegeria marina]
MVSTSTLRVLEPAPNVLAFYDGRISGTRLHSAEWNWLDDAAYALGVASYAVLDGSDALVYDTNISIDHARFVRQELMRRGATSITVVLSHHHKDHVAGTEVFADCQIIAGRKKAVALAQKRDSYGKSNPPIAPLTMPTTVFDGDLAIQVGSVTVKLRPLDIHSHDGVALYLPEQRLLLAGDALEDSVTYVAEPNRLEFHLNKLERLLTWDIAHILPCHGDADRIARGGYDPSFITATKHYVTKLLRSRTDTELAKLTLLEFAKESFESGSLIYCDAYEAVHKNNLQSVLES